MKKRIYTCISNFRKKALYKLKLHFDIDILPEGQQRPDEEKLKELVKDYEILIIGSRERMTKEVYDSKDKLETVGTLSVGLDHIDNSFLKDENITILNVPLANVISVAEHTFAFLLSICKNLKEAEKSARELNGRRGMNSLPSELLEKTIGVVGAGNTGTEVMKIAHCFRMNILCYTFHPKNHSELDKLGVKFVSLEELCKNSDYVTIHLPLTEKSKHLINSKKFELMKEGVVLVNTSREEIVETKSFVENLKNDKIRAAGLDLEDRTIKPYINIENTILTPHIAGITKESIERMDNEIADAIIRYYS